MLARLLPIAVLSLWAPVAFAFPPCPQSPVDIDPLDGATFNNPDLGAGTEPRHQVWYAYVGNSEVYSVLGEPPVDNSTLPGTGNCRSGDMVPLPGLNVASPQVGLSSSQSPQAGYGVLFLPDLRSEPVGSSITYRLSLDVDNTPLAAAGDWVDVMQFSFRWDEWPNGSNLPSTLYRLRVRQPATGVPVLQVIETRATWNTSDDTAPTSEAVVATIPLDNGVATPISLRWFQINRGNNGGYEFAMPIDPEEEKTKAIDPGSRDVVETGIATTSETGATTQYVNDLFFDARFEVIGSDDTLLYGVDLPGQWANEIWMGLLNHHTPTAAADVWTAGVLLENARLQIEY